MKTHHWFLIAFGLAILAQPVHATRYDASNSDLPYVEGEVLVQFTNLTDAATAVQNLDADVVSIVNEIDRVLIDSDRLSTEELLEQFRDQPNVVHVQPNYIYHTLAQVTPWGITTDGVQADVASTNGYTGTNVVVAVIDTGVDYNHEDLDGNMWNAPGGVCTVDGASVACSKHGYDMVSNDSSGDGDGQEDDPLDYHSHGTHVAGTIAAENNDVGVLGVAPNAQIMAVRALDANGSGTTADIAEAIDFATNNAADVINMSIGAFYYDAALETAVTNAWNSGVVVVSAAGNEALQEYSYPAGFEHSISVGAIQQTTTQINPDESMDTRQAYFSNYGTVDVVAPGMRINSTVCDCGSYDGTYSGDTWNGTSMATPHVAGVAALIVEAHPTFTPDQIKQVLESTATDLGETGRDQIFGSGLVNADAATSTLVSTVILIPNHAQDNTNSAPTIYLPELPADGESTTLILTKVTDVTGAFVSGDTITFTTTVGTFSESGTTTYITTTDSNGEATATMVAAAEPGTADVTASSDTYGSATVPVVFANILYVNDTGEWWIGNTLAWWYRQALADAGYAYMRFDTIREHGERGQNPTAEYLSKFDVVIWTVGDYYNLSDANQTALQTAMDNGTSVLLSGQDLLYYVENEFVSDLIFTDYLQTAAEADDGSGATYTGDNGGTNLTGAGIFENITIDLVEYYTNGVGPASGSGLGLLPDWGVLQSGGTSIATYDDVGGEIAATSVTGDGYRTIFLPFGFENVELRDSRSAMFTAAVDFLLGESGSLPSVPTGLELKNRGTKYITPKWNGSAVTYTLSYGTDGAAKNIGKTTTSLKNAKVLGLVSNQRYYFKVKANNNSGSSSYTSAKKMRTTPAKVTNVKIQAVTDSSALVKFKKVPRSVSKYTIKLRNASTGKSTTLRSKRNRKTLSTLVANTLYTVKVRAQKGSINGKWSKSKRFRTDDLL